VAGVTLGVVLGLVGPVEAVAGVTLGVVLGLGGPVEAMSPVTRGVVLGLVWLDLVHFVLLVVLR
jgi:hypothetical protein